MNDSWWEGTYEFYTKEPFGKNYVQSRISCKDIQTFLKRLNDFTGQEFRLPTEAEWEYAANEGKPKPPYRYSGGSNADEVAWYGANSGEHKQSHPYGLKKPNALGLYDMSGNLDEMCSDLFAYNTSHRLTPKAAAATYVPLRNIPTSLRADGMNRPSTRSTLGTMAIQGTLKTAHTTLPSALLQARSSGNGVTSEIAHRARQFLRR